MLGKMCRLNYLEPKNVSIYQKVVKTSDKKNRGFKQRLMTNGYETALRFYSGVENLYRVSGLEVYIKYMLMF